MSDSLQPHESQHAKPPCPSPTPGVHSNSRPSSRWCHQAISSSVIPFSSCPQSLPASESFPMSQLFTWSGQSIGVSASASFPRKKSQGWSPSEWSSLDQIWSLTELPVNYQWLAAVAPAKLLQLCPTLCDPINGSLPGSTIPGILQARTLEWVAISFSNAWNSKVKVKSLSRVRLFPTPWTACSPPGSSGYCLLRLVT